MADVRTLKLSLLADVQKFLSGMDQADNATKSFSSKVGKYSKAMVKSFAVAGAAAGAYAIKIGIDGVKAAVEDEKSQATLAQALKNTTDATDAQIAATEKYISATQIRYGVSDVKLRQSMGNLVRATGDVTEAQKLNNLALDIAASTGRDLETVSLTLAKAYDGNFGSLKKLGIPLDDAIIKTKDFNVVQDELVRLFGGAAAANTETYAGQLAIVTERFDEMKESIGVSLLPIMKTLLEEVNKVAQGFSGDDPNGLSARAIELGANVGDTGAYSLGTALKALADALAALFTTITDDDDKSSSSLQTLASALVSVANGINAVANAYKSARDIGGKVLDLISISPGEGPKFADSRIGKAIGYKSRAAGGSVMPGQVTRVGEFGPELFVSSGSGSVRPDTGGQGVTIIMNGIIDGESARRSIEKLLQDSARRTGAVNFVGATL
jgi:ribosomal protein L35AE/L33A